MPEMVYDFKTAAASALVDAVRIIESQRSQQPEARSATQVARAIDLAHTAGDKLVRHLVSQVDPLLLVSGLNHEVLKSIRAATMRSPSGSIFRSGARFFSQEVAVASKLVSEVTHPHVQPEAYSAFDESLRSLTPLRNHVQHGELEGDSDQLLAVAQRHLAEWGVVAKQLAPDVLDLVSALDGQALSRIKAFKAEVDGAWQVVVDYLAGGHTLALEVRLYIDIQSAEAPLGLTLHGGGLGKNGIMCQTQVPLTEATGHFRKMIASGDMLARTFARQAESPKPSLSFGGPSSGSAGLLEILAGTSKPSPAVPRRLLPLEDGELHIRAAPATISVRLDNLPSRKFVSASVSIVDWTLEARSDERTIPLRGRLVTGVGTPKKAQPEYICISGEIALELETVLEADEEKLKLSAGTTWRVYDGTIYLSLEASAGSVKRE